MTLALLTTISHDSTLAALALGPAFEDLAGRPFCLGLVDMAGRPVDLAPRISWDAVDRLLLKSNAVAA